MATWAAAMVLATAKIDPKMWLFLFTFSQVQLAEFFIWRNNSKAANAFLMLVLLLEPVASINLLKTPLRNQLWAIYALGITYWLATRKVTLTSEVAENGHLKWKFFEPPMPVTIGWVVALIAPLFLSGRTSAGVFAVLTAAVTLSQNYKYGTWGTMWCWVAILGWLLEIL